MNRGSPSMLLASDPVQLLKRTFSDNLCFLYGISFFLHEALMTWMNMYNKSFLAVVVATGITMLINNGSFHDMYGRNLFYFFSRRLARKRDSIHVSYLTNCR
jgi:hypothetical protein